MNRSFRFAIAAAAVLVTASVAASAQAYLIRHVDVAFGDLDLSMASDRHELATRIDSAAAMACGGNPAFAGNYRDATRYHQKAFAECRTQARQRALTYLARQGVVALH